jgi:hypothetical protein
MAELHLWGRPALGRGADRSCAPDRKADALAVTAKDAMLLSCLLAHEIADAHDRQALAPTRRPADLSHIVVGCSEGRKLTTGQILAAVSAVMSASNICSPTQLACTVTSRILRKNRSLY